MPSAFFPGRGKLNKSFPKEDKSRYAMMQMRKSLRDCVSSTCFFVAGVCDFFDCVTVWANNVANSRS